MVIENKRGIFRIIEASIAVLIVLGVIVSVNIQTKQNLSSENLDSLKNILEEISKNSELRDIIVSYNLEIQDSEENAVILEKIRIFVEERLTKGYSGFEIKICDINSNCYIDAKEIYFEIYSAERVISTNLENSNYSPRKIKIFTWKE